MRRTTALDMIRQGVFSVHRDDCDDAEVIAFPEMELVKGGPPRTNRDRAWRMWATADRQSAISNP